MMSSISIVSSVMGDHGGSNNVDEVLEVCWTNRVLLEWRRKKEEERSEVKRGGR